MNTQTRALLLVGHGSLLAESGVAMLQIATDLRARQVAPIVEAGFLNYSQPTVAEALTKCVAQGATAVIVQPYFLISGSYVVNDLPAVVQAAASHFPQLRVQIGQPLGAHAGLAQLATKRLAASAAEPSADSALLFVAHGTPLASANAPIAWVLVQTAQLLGYEIKQVGYLDCNQPDIPTAFDRLAATGAKRIAVLPYFLHLGRHVRRDLPTLFDQARHDHPQIDLVIAEHLGYDPLLAAVVAERITEISCPEIERD